MLVGTLFRSEEGGREGVCDMAGFLIPFVFFFLSFGYENWMAGPAVPAKSRTESTSIGWTLGEWLLLISQQRPDLGGSSHPQHLCSPLHKYYSKGKAGPAL